MAKNLPLPQPFSFPCSRPQSSIEGFEKLIYGKVYILLTI
jgi:hypothetical protein